jgi:E3 ubiquitin-protein ligase UHRF1
VLQVNRELMDVIESLKSKTEEENGKSIEESSEEADGFEPSVDPSPTSSETKTENPEITGAEDGVQSPPTKSKPKRSLKQKEVDVGECSLENEDGLENKIPSKKADAEGCSLRQSVGRKTRSRKAEEDAVDENIDVGVRTRGRKSQKVVDEGNDSPSSPLVVQSDDDFE